MNTHKNLRIWQQSIDLASMIYTATKSFPKEELYGLVSQMRRAAVSIPSNISEGYARGSNSEKLHFLRISSGSLSELETQLLLSNRFGYIDTESYDNISSELTSVWKQLNALISNIRARMV